MSSRHTRLVDELIWHHTNNKPMNVAYRNASADSYDKLCDAIEDDFKILDKRQETLHPGLYKLTKDLFARRSMTGKGKRWIEAFKVVLEKKRACYTREKVERKAAEEEALNKLIIKVKMEWASVIDEDADDLSLMKEIAARKTEDPLYKAYVMELMKIASNDQVLEKVESRLKDAAERPQLLCAKLVAHLNEMMRLGQKHIQKQFDRKLKGMIAAPTTAADSSLAILLYGKPGTGKTTLATKIGNLFSAMGLLVREGMEIHSSADFIAEYKGQTAPKTANILIQNLEKSLFLDEAYDLTKYEIIGGTRKLSQYSEEAINMITALLTQMTGRICFIVAGYEKEMFEDFLPANPGLDRRFTIRFECPDKDPEELATIFVDRTRTRLCDMNFEMPNGTVTKLTRLMQAVFDWYKGYESSQIDSDYEILLDIKRRVARLQTQDVGKQRMKMCSVGDHRVRDLDLMALGFEQTYCENNKYDAKLFEKDDFKKYKVHDFEKYKNILRECKGLVQMQSTSSDEDLKKLDLLCLYEFFKNQAGAMATLADEAVEVAAYHKYDENDTDEESRKKYDDKMLDETILNKVDDSMFGKGRTKEELTSIEKLWTPEYIYDHYKTEVFPNENALDCLSRIPSTKRQKTIPLSKRAADANGIFSMDWGV